MLLLFYEYYYFLLCDLQYVATSPTKNKFFSYVILLMRQPGYPYVSPLQTGPLGYFFSRLFLSGCGAKDLSNLNLTSKLHSMFNWSNSTSIFHRHTMSTIFMFNDWQWYTGNSCCHNQNGNHWNTQFAV